METWYSDTLQEVIVRVPLNKMPPPVAWKLMRDLLHHTQVLQELFREFPRSEWKRFDDAMIRAQAKFYLQTETEHHE